MRNTVHNLGTAGIVKDIKPQLLPPEFWTDGRNVRFQQNRVTAQGGVLLGREKTGVINAGLIASPTKNYIIYTNGEDVFSWDGTTEFEITKSATTYNEDLDNLFEILSFNGFGILNNGIDIPQLWDPSVGSNLLVNLTNWDTDWTAKVIRPFKAFLIALNMTDGVDEQPHKMRWSTPAVPGAVPSSWVAAPDNEAGEFDFPDTNKGVLVSGLEMGDRFYVYKEGSIWGFTYGGSTILSRNQIVDNVGLFVKRSLVNIPFTKAGQKLQFFVGDDNFYVMNGLTVVPVFENVFKNEILALVDKTNWRDRAFSVVNYRAQEVWFCIPQTGEDYATLAFCFNFANETYAIRELSGASTIISGIGFDSLAGSTQQDLPYSDQTFFSDNTGFFNTEVIPGKSVVLETAPLSNKLFYLDIGELDYDQTNEMPAYVERQAVPTTKNDTRNEKADIVDYRRKTVVHNITGKFYEGSAGLIIGTQENENDSVFYLPEHVLPTDDFKYDLPVPITTRFHTFRFFKLPGQKFALGGYDYECSKLGIY